MKKKAPRSRSEIESKLRKVKLQLEQFQELKKILREEGIKPDDDDRQKESRLIQQVLGFEKDLKRMSKGGVQPEAGPGKFAKAKSKVRRHT